MRRGALALALAASSWAGACARARAVEIPDREPPAAPAPAQPVAGPPTLVAPARARAPIRHELRADDGHLLALWEKGPQGLESRGVIVLLHGRTWSALPDFDLQVEGESLSLMDGLAQAGYRSYALDLRGYGGSLRDATGWIDPDRAAADLTSALRWVSEREATRPALLGWSQGAWVAHLAVQREPALVDALILYGYPGRTGGPIPETIAAGEPARRANTAAAAASDFITEGSISRRAIEAFVETALAADPVRVDWRAVHGFNELDPEALRVPTLVIHGERDPIADEAGQAALFAGIAHPDRQWIVLPAGDHAAHLEHPARFLAAVRGFLEAPEVPPVAR